MSKFTFLMNLIMKSKELKVSYHQQAVFSLSQFHFLHFLQCIAISYFHNNKYIIISDLTRGETDVIGKNGPKRLQGSGKKLYWFCFIIIIIIIIIIWLKHLNRFSCIKLESIHAGHNLDKNSIGLSDPVLFYENYTKLYFDPKHTQKTQVWIEGGKSCIALFFKEKCPF